MNEWDMSHQNRVAWRKCGKVEGWEPCAWEIIDVENYQTSDMLITGGIPKIITKGKRKGQKSWDKSVTRRCSVSDAEIEAERQLFITETGKCPECLGKGSTYMGWNHIDGIKTRPCRLCSKELES